ncbi:hypothetical protein SAMN02990966_06456 [Rhodospirillales bacterium URHD0017]|nr:hypothetical protein SAMN02990966_06456 [Rhodospirillales bacterium URHD0017]
MTATKSSFERLLAEDVGREKRIFWSEVGVAALMAFALLAYLFAS